MRNFAVAATDEIIAKGVQLIESEARPGETKGETLGRLFDMLTAMRETESIQQGGVDTEALEASLANIRSQFASLVSAKQQVIASREALLRETREKMTAAEEDLKNKVQEAQTALQAAKESEKEARKAAGDAEQDAKNSREQAATVAALVSEKERTIQTLAEKLAAAEEKAAGYDRLEKAKTDLEKSIDGLKKDLSDQKASYELQIASIKREHEYELQTAHADSDRKLSEAKKDAEVACEKAVMARERELNGSFREQIRLLDKENAALAVQLEALQRESQGDAEDKSNE
jgi:chromosome segregation ATPase